MFVPGLADLKYKQQKQIKVEKQMEPLLNLKSVKTLGEVLTPSPFISTPSLDGSIEPSHGKKSPVQKFKRKLLSITPSNLRINLNL